MRALERNKISIYYANYAGTETLRDKQGNIIGVNAVYANPTKIRANVSASKGNVGTEMFGIDTGYTKIINPLSNTVKISETSVLWVDVVPEIKTDGSTDTPWDYTIARIAKSLNHTAVAIKKVDVGIGDVEDG